MTARDTLRILAPVMGKERINRLWKAYLSANALDRREIEFSLEAHAARLLNDTPAKGETGWFPPPPPEKCLGDIDLGKAVYGDKEMYLFGLRKEELLRHVGIYGSSGSGKSNGIALILDGLKAQGIPFLLVDFKRTFRALLKEYPDLLVFTAGDADTAPFRLNPLIPPPGTSTQVWLRKVTGALSHGFMQGAGSESLLITAMTDAYQEAGKTGRWPTFVDVAEQLEKVPARGRKGMWLDSAKRAVTSLTAGNARDVFCHAEALDLAGLLNASVILELDLLNQAEQTFLSEVLLLWIIQYRMNQSGPREELRHVVLIEEAHHLLRAPPGVGDGSEPVIHIALREVRELGESIILATQNASIVPVSVFGNQATTLAFHTKHASDVRATAQAMLLKDECKDELGRLPVGEAIVRIPRWQEPARIRLNFRPIAKGAVTDARICQTMRDRMYSTDTAAFCRTMAKPGPLQPIPRQDDKQTRIAELEEPATQVSTRSTVEPTPTTTPKNNGVDKGASVNRSGSVDLCTPAFQPLAEQRPSIASVIHAGQAKAGTKLLCLTPTTGLELAFLQDIVRHPYDGVVQRIKRLQTSRRKGTAALQSLEKRGLLKPVSIQTGQSTIKLFDLPKEGRALCHQQGYGPLPNVTEGGILHRYWVHHTAQKLRAEGWTVQTEYPVHNNLIVDIHAEKDGKTMAVLVETGKSNVEHNIKKTRLSGYFNSTYMLYKH